MSVASWCCTCFCVVLCVSFLYGPFCHGAFKLDIIIYIVYNIFYFNISSIYIPVCYTSLDSQDLPPFLSVTRSLDTGIPIFNINWNLRYRHWPEMNGSPLFVWIHQSRERTILPNPRRTAIPYHVPPDYSIPIINCVELHQGRPHDCDLLLYGISVAHMDITSNLIIV